jgi:hypothetical protein
VGVLRSRYIEQYAKAEFVTYDEAIRNGERGAAAAARVNLFYWHQPQPPVLLKRFRIT